MPYKDPEKAKEYNRQYRLKNKEKMDDYRKEWRKTDEGKMSDAINSWKYTHKMKLREGEDWESIYIHYLITERCEVCDKKLIKKCLDHDHKSGFIRNVLCYSCNANRAYEENL